MFNHEAVDQRSLVICSHRKIAKGLIIGIRQIEVEVHEGKDVLGRPTHHIRAGLGLFFLLLLTEEVLRVDKGVLEDVSFDWFVGLGF